MNKKLFKGALVLFASILMAVSCSSNSKPGDDDTTQKPGGDTTTPAKEKLAITLKTSENDGSTQAKAIKFKMQNGTTAPQTLPNIEFSGNDSTDLKFEGEEGVVGKVKSVKGLKKSEIDSSLSSFDSKSDKADITLDDIAQVKLARIDETKCSITFEQKTLTAIGTAVDTDKFGMIEVVITFTDKSGKKESVDVTVLVGITRAA